jgi:hypothetical protein
LNEREIEMTYQSHEAQSLPVIELPQTPDSNGSTLFGALQARHTIRNIRDTLLPRATLANLL